LIALLARAFTVPAVFVAFFTFALLVFLADVTERFADFAADFIVDFAGFFIAFFIFLAALGAAFLVVDFFPFVFLPRVLAMSGSF
jgi:hypothetical protein